MSDERDKLKLSFIISCLTFCTILVGYGIWVGDMSSKIKVLEEKTQKLENTVGAKLDSINKAMTELNVNVAVLNEKVELIKNEMKKGE